MASSKRLLKSKIIAWAALITVLVMIVLTFRMRCAWWACIDMFFAFMMVFAHIASLYLERFNAFASRRLDAIALVCGFMTLLAIIGEYIAYALLF